MPYFEVVPEEFNGGTDATDHLVLWGRARTIEQVCAQYPDAHVYPLGIECIPAAHDFNLYEPNQ